MSQKDDGFCSSVFWDPDLMWNGAAPKIPICFEQTVLVWLPCAFLWIFTPLEIGFMKNNLARNIPWNFFNIAKLLVNVLLIALAAIDLGLAVYRKNDGGTVYGVEIVTPSVKLVTFILSAALVFYNRKFGIRTSGTMFIFWLLLVILSIPQCLTEVSNKNTRALESESNGDEDYFWEEYKYISFMIYFTLIILSLIFSSFSDGKPKEMKYPKKKMDCPFTTASFLSRITYQWFDSLAWKGYKKPLEEHDLWDLRAEDQSKEIMPAFAKNWNNTVHSNKIDKSIRSPKVEQAKKDGKVVFDNPKATPAKRQSSILPAICKSFAGLFVFGAFLEFIKDILTFASPEILKLTIGFVEKKYSDDPSESEPIWKGIVYAVLLFLVAALQTFILSQYNERMLVVGMRIRTALINAIYRKALVISNATRKESTVGEIVNLMAVDAQRFQELTLYINMLWSAPFQIALALYFLWNILGPSVMAGLAVMIIMIPINGYIAGVTKKLQVSQMKQKDNRVKLMNEILSGMKVLKLYAWEPSFERQVLKIRSKEIVTLKGAAHLNAVVYFIWTFAPFLVSLVTFATFVLVDKNNVLDAKTAFVSLSLFNILRMPLMMLPIMITNMIQTQVSVNRINNFMNSEELDPDNVQHDPKYAKVPVLIEDGSFSWGDKEACIKNINISAKKGSLVAIVGTVGSGKTSVVSAILGEMDKMSGFVNTIGKIAYVPQQAWLRNCTLRDNILFGLPYDRRKYQRVIDACALKADIEMLSAGDQTEIGEKGINMSGGQKQRIALARAVYADADVYLFDDPLSAVDSHVGKHIFEEVIGPNGVLVNKTKILVTHGVVFLPQTDKIYVLKNGEVSENGTYQELLDNKGAFAEFLLHHINQEVDDEQDLQDIKQVLEKAASSEDIIGKLEEVISKVKTETVSDTSSIVSQGSLRRRNITRKDSTVSVHSIKEAEKKFQEGKLIEAEKTQTGKVKWEVYKHYIQSIGIGMAIGTVILNIAFTAFQIGSNMWLTVWADDVRVANDTSLRDLYLGVYGGLGLAQAITVYFAFLLISLGCLYSSKIMHDLLLKFVIHWPMEVFDITPQGRVLNRFSKDVDTLDNVLPSLLRLFISQVFAVLSTVIVISISTPIFLAAVVPISLLYYLVQRFYVATSRQLMRLESVTRSPIYSHFSETVTGVTSIRAYNVQEEFVEQNDDKVDHNQACKFPNIIANRWLAIRLEMVGNLIILFSALFAILGEQSNAGLVGLSITYALQITQSMNWLVRMTSDIETNIVSVERIKEYGETKQEAEWVIEETTPSPQWPEEGRVNFSDYRVRYREGLDLVLRGINFEVNGGEKIGIVGRTGAGKSSLTLALFRIIEAAGGKITIDGIDISILGLHALRSRLTIIPQDPVLFSGTLRMNLDPFESNSDEEIWKSLELAHLKSFVTTLDAGLNHEISEGGENLSVGQRQLVCLARALLRKTKVLILDEATAAVDLGTDDLIQKTIRTEFKECTVLTIAHRLNTIMDSDRVIVLDKGEISEFASPSHLLQNRDSIFYSMAKDANLVS